MVSVNLLHCVPLLLFGWSQVSHGGNVLVFPGEYSHWLNMRVMIEELVNRNHSVTVLVSTSSPSVKYTQPERFSFKVFHMTHSKDILNNINNEIIRYWMYEAQSASMLQVGLKVRELMGQLTAYLFDQCDAMLRNDTIVDSLKRSKFDVILTDPMLMCGDLMADLLGIPLVLSLRFTLGMALESNCGQLPTPPSFVPLPPSLLTDQMSFFERVHNTMMLAFHSALLNLHVIMNVNPFYSELVGRPTTFCEMMGKADIWLIRTHWDFDYPRPFLPNFQFVGGLHCKPAKPLPAYIEEFVETSGDDGIVVFSLGSMVKNLTKERRNTIATALGQIPQKVIWRYSGEKPDTLAPNTRVYDWIPQNDLLGHPKTKAFIAHGGTNGLYEAIYHGVPMVGIPLFGDQPDNIGRIQTRGGAVMLDFNKMNS